MSSCPLPQGLHPFQYTPFLCNVRQVIRLSQYLPPQSIPPSSEPEEKILQEPMQALSQFLWAQTLVTCTDSPFISPINILTHIFGSFPSVLLVPDDWNTGARLRLVRILEFFFLSFVLAALSGEVYTFPFYFLETEYSYAVVGSLIRSRCPGLPVFKR